MTSREPMAVTCMECGLQWTARRYGDCPGCQAQAGMKGISDLNQEVARLREERDRLSADFNQLLANQDALSGHLLKRDAQLARLRAYVQHRGECVFAPQVLASTRRRICTCGLDAALAGPAEEGR